jgi:hypothetical protein
MHEREENARGEGGEHTCAGPAFARGTFAYRSRANCAVCGVLGTSAFVSDVISELTSFAFFAREALVEKGCERR